MGFPWGFPLQTYRLSGSYLDSRPKINNRTDHPVDFFFLVLRGTRSQKSGNLDAGYCKNPWDPQGMSSGRFFGKHVDDVTLSQATNVVRKWLL